LRLVLASGNPDKVREIKEILADIEVLPLSSLVDKIEIEESGLTFRENAYIKARTAFELTGCRHWLTIQASWFTAFMGCPAFSPAGLLEKTPDTKKIGENCSRPFGDCPIRREGLISYA